MTRLAVSRCLFFGALLTFASASVARAQDAKPTDAQIFAIVSAANNGEINAGKLAKDKATQRDVKKFAADMVTDHTKMQSQGDKLAAKLKITPEQSPMSNELTQGADTTMTKLQGLSGAAFDQAYVDAQVADHTKVLSTMDATLIPSAQNKQLKSMLKNARATVASHLRHAEHLQEKLRKEAGRSADNDH